MSSKCEMLANGTESNGLNLFSQIKGIAEQSLSTSLLPQVVLIFSIKPISSSISLNFYGFKFRSNCQRFNGLYLPLING